jgi:hypothetical protein
MENEILLRENKDRFVILPINGRARQADSAVSNNLLILGWMNQTPTK